MNFRIRGLEARQFDHLTHGDVRNGFGLDDCAPDLVSRSSSDIKQVTRQSSHQVIQRAIELRGFSNREIAERLGISIGTVKVHLQAIYEKLNVHNRTKLGIALMKYSKLRGRKKRKAQAVA